MTTQVCECIAESLQVGVPMTQWTAQDIDWIRKQAEVLAARSFNGDEACRKEMHQTAYALFLAHHVQPWKDAAVDISNPIFASFLWVLGAAWDREDRDRNADLLQEIPVDPSGYPAWVTGVVREHRSNVSHPLFKFLAEKASYAQLREMVLQETPFDIFFADILGSLLPGIYDEPKMEIADNFWDEMGQGNLTRAHRTLRLQLMEHLEIPAAVHLGAADRFLLEELELANAYFFGAIDRSRAVQLIGMLMATESMVPGRLERQIEGWRRVGLPDSKMAYLTEHVVVDAEHAEHWMKHVVEPIIHERPGAMVDLTLGAQRRLDIAAKVCDRMLDHLIAMEAS